MKRTLFVSALVLFLGFLSAVLANAQAKRQAAEFDARIAKELARQNPEAVAVFAEANQARDRRDFVKAAELYSRVRELAPKFCHAVRRLGNMQLELGRRKQAIETLNEARAMENVPENLTALASALSSSLPESKPTSAELKEALEWAGLAAQRAPEDYYAQLVFAEIALTNHDLPGFKKGVLRLLIVAPKEIPTHFYKAILDLSEGDYSSARRSIKQARDLGLPQEEYQRVSKIIDGEEPLPLRLLPAAGKVIGAWVVALLVLFIFGWMLSRAVLSAARRLPPDNSGRVRGFDAALRRVYAAVLWLCSAFYWISLPIVAAIVLLGGAGVLYAFYAAGRFPIKIAILIVLIIGYTLSALAKSLFVRAKESDPGPRLDMGKNPRLKAVLQEVSEKIDTRPVDVIFLTPGADIAVFERGGMSRQLRGAQERALILGAAALDGLRLSPFKAVLAHEYGHLSNRDTAGGGFALAVRRSLMIMAQNLAGAGVAKWYNPAWLFLIAFYRIFLRLSHGASRLQEVMADRWAAFAYGARAFEEGLRHVVGQAIRFEAHADATIKEVVDKKLSLSNLYAYQPSQAPPEQDLESKVEAALNAKPSPYDSHPPSRERFAMVHALKIVETASVAAETAMAWDLFSDRQQIERDMTSLVRANVAAGYGITIPGEPEVKTASA